MEKWDPRLEFCFASKWSELRPAAGCVGPIWFEICSVKEIQVAMPSHY